MKNNIRYLTLILLFSFKIVTAQLADATKRVFTEGVSVPSKDSPSLPSGYSWVNYFPTAHKFAYYNVFTNTWRYVLDEVSATGLYYPLSGNPSDFSTPSNTQTFTNKTWNGALIGDAYISSAGTWNSKQNALSGTGIVKSTAGTITYVTDNSTNWNTAYGWGNHAGLYPTYSGSGATGTWGINVTGNSGTSTLAANSTLWNSQTYTVSPGGTFSYFLGFDGTNWGRMTAAQAETSMGWTKANWNAAYSWGDHALAGYSTPSNTQTFTNKTWNGALIGDAYISSAGTWNGKQSALSGTGIVKSSSGSISYVVDNSANWNSAYSWGNHALAGYLTSYTETDPNVPSHVKSITTTEKSNWNTAFGWGNHASAGYEITSNKSADTLLGSSNTLFPTQKAVKTYVDHAIDAQNSSGTWTPSGTASLATSTGTYYKSGKLIIATFNLIIQTNTSSTQISISGLPFTPLASLKGFTDHVITYDFTYTDQIAPILVSGNILFNKVNNGAAGFLNYQDLSNSVIQGTIMYYIN